MKKHTRSQCTLFQALSSLFLLCSSPLFGMSCSIALTQVVTEQAVQSAAIQDVTQNVQVATMAAQQEQLQAAATAATFSLSKLRTSIFRDNWGHTDSTACIGTLNSDIQRPWLTYQQNKIPINWPGDHHHMGPAIEFTRKKLIQATRHSVPAKSLIANINQRFIDFCTLLNQSRTTLDYERALQALYDIHRELNKINQLGPISYLLSPEIKQTLCHIELPLSEVVAGKKASLSENDVDQIVWAIERHFKSMQYYTQQAQCHIPAGRLKDTMDAYQASRLTRPFRWLSRSARLAYRDTCCIKPSVQTYSEIAARKNSLISSRIMQADYQQLHQQIKTQGKAIELQAGTLSEYHQSRQKALNRIVQGETAIEQKIYSLNPQASQALHEADIDPQEFIHCKGNLVQQDTHEKFIHTINKLAQKPLQGRHAQQMQEGMLECVQAGNACNQSGYIESAMAIADMCSFVYDASMGISDGILSGVSSWWHRDASMEPVLSAANPTHSSGTRVTIAEPISEFTYFTLESIEKITRIAKGITTGTIDGIAHINLKQTAFDLKNGAIGIARATAYLARDLLDIDYALKHGNFDEAMHLCQQNNKALAQFADALGSAAFTASQELQQTIQDLPKISPYELEQLTHGATAYVSQHVLEGYIAGKCISGMSKLTRSFAHQAQSISSIASKTRTFTKQQFHQLALISQLERTPMYVSRSMPYKPNIEWFRAAEIASMQPSQVIAFAFKHPELMGPIRSMTTATKTIASLYQTTDFRPVLAVANTLRNLCINSREGLLQPGYVQLPRVTPASSSTLLLTDFLTTDGAKIDVCRLDLDNLPLHLYDESIGDVSKLQQLTSQFKDIPGAMGKDGPLQKVLEMGYKDAKKGSLNAARGAIYELEVAQRLRMAGEKINGFNIKMKFGTDFREFDIISNKLCIECKNIDWAKKINLSAQKLKSQLCKQRRIASGLNKKFELHSKQSIPLHWKRWLNLKNIIFIEGL